MKTVLCTFSGEPETDDLIMINARDPRGGRSTIKYKVKEGDTLSDILNAFAGIANSGSSEFCPGTGDFRTTVNDNDLCIMCSDAVQACKFDYDIEGSKGVFIAIKVLG